MAGRAIITGPTGAVGISLIQELVENGIYVVAVCRPGSKRVQNIPVIDRVSVIECDLSQMDRLPGLVEGIFHCNKGTECAEFPDTFYHFAWNGTYGADRQDEAMQQANIVYSMAAVRAAKAIGCEVFIGAGSQSEFGHVSGKMSPDLSCHPDTAYGKAKLAAGLASKQLCEELGLRYNWCRILSLYGPYDAPYTMVMSSIAKMLSGEHAAFSPGEQVWDYIYSKDAARAFRLVACHGRAGAVYCLGSGKTRQLKEYIIAMKEAVETEQGFSVSVGIGELPYYPNQVMHLEADISSLTEDTGFVPTYSFDEGIKETVNWIHERI